MPVLNDLKKSYKLDDLEVIGITYSDTADEVQEFQKTTRQDYLIAIGYKEITPLPTTYIVDSSKRIRKKMVGLQDRATLTAAIETILKEGP